MIFKPTPYIMISLCYVNILFNMSITIQDIQYRTSVISSEYEDIINIKCSMFIKEWLWLLRRKIVKLSCVWQYKCVSAPHLLTHLTALNYRHEY